MPIGWGAQRFTKNHLAFCSAHAPIRAAKPSAARASLKGARVAAPVASATALDRRSYAADERDARGAGCENHLCRSLCDALSQETRHCPGLWKNFISSKMSRRLLLLFGNEARL
jgi:hypothetical protein